MQIQLTHSLFSSLLRSQLEIRDEVISFQAYFSSPDIGSTVLHIIHGVVAAVPSPAGWI